MFRISNVIICYILTKTNISSANKGEVISRPDSQREKDIISKVLSKFADKLKVKCIIPKFQSLNIVI